jgi:tRNA 2-thiocytidine biosynthesis protein TtcA
VYVTEAEARAYTAEVGLPVIGCCCPACGDLSLKRQRIKRLIAELELEHPDIKNSMIAALGHVVPSHLLDPGVSSRTTHAPSPKIEALVPDR